MATLPTLMTRYFTKSLEQHPEKTVYDLFDWDFSDVMIKDHKSGRILTDMKNLEFPIQYSQNSRDIIASKYFRKAGVKDSVSDGETSMRQVAHRLVNFWIASLRDEKIIKTDSEAKIIYDELVFAFLSQMYAPNSPQWFNTGLKLSYGIEGGKSGLFYYDEAKGEVVESIDDYTRTQASACFILSIEDKLLGAHSISEEYVTETRLFRGGSGTGTNFSAIRAEGERLTGGGASSGLMSFLKGLDRNAGAIKSGGTTRRAAKMVCLDIDHPEIESFMLWKAREEDKVIALAKMGYDADMDGEAYQTVSGQNSNNSVRLSDDFMTKVVNLESDPDAELVLRGRVDERVNKSVKVGDIWHKFNEAAWRCADPAPQFDDTFNAWHTCPSGEDGQTGAKHNRLNSTNPCGEYAFLDDTSCNLASINVLRFYNAETEVFDLAGYEHLITLVQLVLEASIHWGHFPTADIARKTWLFRSTGLGMANLASLLMALGLPYDSNEARALAAALVGILTGRSYYISALMSEAAGPFAKYDINRDAMQRVIRNHARVAGARADDFEDLAYTPVLIDHALLKKIGFANISKSAKESWKQAEATGEKYGYRNAQVSVMAPTGTISFAMDCAATSIEPYFSHVSYKKLSGGGFMKLANPSIGAGLKKLGYTTDQITEIIDYIMREEDGMIVDGKIEGAPHLKDEHLAVFDTANQCGSGERYIHYMGHVLMVAALTPLLSGAISKTVNLPKEATVDDFKEVVISSWRLGVKGITLYRDGSKFAQPLNLRLEAISQDQALKDLKYAQLLEYAEKTRERNRRLEQQNAVPHAYRRDKPMGIRAGHTHPAQVEDVKIYTTVNRNSHGEISEIYITTDREGTLIMGLLNSLSKTISVMLQYRIPPQNISKMLRGQKYEPYGFVTRHPYIKYCTSISDMISKIIDIEIGDYSRCQVKPEGTIVSQHAGTETTPPVVTEVITEALSGIHIDLNDDDDDGDVNPQFPNLREPEYSTGIQAEPATDGSILDASPAFVHESAKEAAKSGEKLYDGSTCPTCSSTRMVRNGTCKVCLDCGTTTGCS
ncbi:MAG: vitamin B12-dependent ribonucleotide reductase [Eubacteriales bacterium]|nr:vitamin B12-dependent ribonucleotide reductase [Eubacteriales bacterium]